MTVKWMTFWLDEARLWDERLSFAMERGLEDLAVLAIGGVIECRENAEAERERC